MTNRNPTRSTTAPASHVCRPSKKTLVAAEQTRPAVAAGRAEFRAARRVGLDPDRFVFPDETCVKTNMTRLYGRRPRGERLVEYAPHGHWLTTTFVGALRAPGLVAPLVVDGAINGAIFRAWVGPQLARALRPGDIVVMDTLAAHKVAGVREAVEAADAELVYLPPYSPDLNPIENLFAKVKIEMRTPRTKAACDDLCGECPDWFPAAECRNYFRHAGYVPQHSN